MVFTSYGSELAFTWWLSCEQCVWQLLMVSGVSVQAPRPSCTARQLLWVWPSSMVLVSPQPSIYPIACSPSVTEVMSISLHLAAT